MAKKSKQIGMDHSTTKKPRGRTSISDKVPDVSPTKRRTMNEKQTQVSKSVNAGSGPRRGDRRDMHPKFSTGKTKSAGGKRGPTGRSTRKGG